MSLPRLMFDRLREGSIPVGYTSKPVSIVAERARKSASMLLLLSLNSASKLKRITFIKSPVKIKDHGVSGHVGVIDGVLVSRYGDELVFSSIFENESRRPTIAKVRASVDGKGKLMHVLFMPNSYYELDVGYSVVRPSYVSFKSSVESEYGSTYDELSLNYALGVLDNRPKPVSEYPIYGCDNVELDLYYDWRVGSYVYPSTLPSGLSFSNLSLSYVYGFIWYEGVAYKDPRVNNRVRACCTVRNNTGSTIRMVHYGLPISVMYEDNRHVSQLNAPISFPTVNMPSGSSYSYCIDVNIPSQFYGRIAIAHALSFYKGDYPIYFGGPVFQFEAYRLLLP